MKMKVLKIIPSFYPATVYGGPIFSTLATCEELAKFSNVELKVCTTNTNMYSKLDVETGKFLSFAQGFKVKYYNELIIDKFSLSLFFNIWKDIKEADIIHIQAVFNTPVIASLFFAVFFKKPILLSPRGSFGKWSLTQGSSLKSFWLKYLIKPFAKKIVWHATSLQEEKEILDIFKNAKTVVIPNGIKFPQRELNYKQEKLLQVFNIQSQRINKLIISMGRIHKKKRFDILILSFKKILKKYPNSFLLIAGKDEGERSSLEKLIIKENLINNTFFIGEVQGKVKVEFYTHADVFVLPSENENFGNVYAESLACGTPIVASLNTPWEEIEKAQCGKWVANTVDATSDAVLELLKQNKQELSLNAKKYIKKYAWESVAKKFNNCYEELLVEK